MGLKFNATTGDLDVVEKGATLGTLTGATDTEILYGASDGTVTSSETLVFDTTASTLTIKDDTTPASYYCKISVDSAGNLVLEGSGNKVDTRVTGTRINYNGSNTAGLVVIQKPSDNSEALFYTSGGAGGIYLRAADTSYFANEVSIGKSSDPDRMLEVTDDTNPQIRLTQTDETNYVDLQATSTGGLLMLTSSGADRYIEKQNIASGGLVKLKASINNGFGRFQTLDATDHCVFRCGTTSVVLESASANIANSNTAGKICIYISGGDLFLRNNFAGTSSIMWDVTTL